MRRAILVFSLLLASPAIALPICGAGKRINCVVDGDTIWLHREKIRLEGIDASELTEPRCASEAQRAWAAAERLAQLTEGPAILTLVRR